MICDVRRVARLRAWYAQRHSGPGPLSIPSKLGRPGHAGLLILAGLLLSAAETGAQTRPDRPPDLQPDEKDFEGLSSLSLGSGARALGMGGAFLARADDATAAAWNPAGLSYLRRPEVSLVGGRSTFSKQRQDYSDRLLGYTPDFAAVTYPVETGHISGAVQLSFQRVFSFSGNRKIRDDTAPLTIDTQGSGGFDVLALGTGLKVGRSLRLGVTVNHWFNGYSQSRSKVAGNRTQLQEIEYGLSGWNFNLGLIWNPVESLNFGAVGKTAFTGSVDLARNRTYPDPTNPENVPRGSSRDSTLKLHVPGAFGVGVSWRPRSALTLSADYTVTLWSKGRIHNFFLLDPQNRDQPTKAYDSLPYPTLDDNDQLDSQQFRFGAEYVVIGSRLKVPLRAGFFTDRQYFRGAGPLDATGRDLGTGEAPSFRGLTAGVGVLVGPFLLDAAYVYERGSYQDYDSRTQATTTTQRLFLSLIYRHGSND